MTPHITIGAATDVGNRKAENEDAYAFFPPEQGQSHPKGLLMALADGMGGRAGGARASKIAVDTLMSRFYDAPSENIAESLRLAFVAAHEEVIGAGEADLQVQGMATTLTAAVIFQDRLYHAHVGDSRAYIADKNGLRIITEDHSYVASLVRAGAITAEQAETHPQRNLVTQAIGASENLRIDLADSPHVLEDDSVVLLCCDGLYKDLPDSDILSVIRATKDPAAATGKLVSMAKGRGGADNITALMARVEDIGGLGNKLRRIFHKR